MIDITHEISSAARQVGTRTLPAGEAKVVTISRTYDTDLDDLWDACTNPERIPRWFLPITGDLRVGGRYQLEGNAGGTIERCEPPTELAATWEYGDEISWVELTLHPTDDGRTTFRLEHIAHVDDERWDQFGPGAVGVGWDGAVLGLGQYLAGHQADPEELIAWSTSAEGRDFYARASEQWYQASVAAGTDPALARAAADRTTEFYTAAPA